MEHNVQWSGGTDQKKKESGSRRSSTQSDLRAPAMRLSAASGRGLKEPAGLPKPGVKPGVKVDDGGVKLDGAIAPGVLEFDPPAMELPAKTHCPELGSVVVVVAVPLKLQVAPEATLRW